MSGKKFIFIAGHHRSGTSLLHTIVRSHPMISGFANTGVPKDEGQFLQSVYKNENNYGGPGKYLFDKRIRMDETHPLANPETAARLQLEWERYHDTNRPCYVEKTPSNMVRTRFLQNLFPESHFIMLLRHPMMVAYATQKWSKTLVRSLVEHSLLGYEIFWQDKEYLRNVHILHYEDFVIEPQKKINDVLGFLGLEPIAVQQEIRDANVKYFNYWRRDAASWWRRWQLPRFDERLERRANVFGYSFQEPYRVDQASK